MSRCRSDQGLFRNAQSLLREHIVFGPTRRTVQAALTEGLDDIEQSCKASLGVTERDTARKRSKNLLHKSADRFLSQHATPGTSRTRKSHVCATSRMLNILKIRRARPFRHDKSSARRADKDESRAEREFDSRLHVRARRSRNFEFQEL